ncbi:ubiquitin conjugating enzyme [Aureococcus anophagefferens]|uniref:Ubiquitin conjugating enzyme n=1 Tax=Aureococcus anophagefferens TaxID=44056 RepID=A0ABR1G6E6_AURAN
MGPLSTVYENRLYSCELARPGALRGARARQRRRPRAVCGPRYPSVPPENMRKLMPNWKYANTIADVLGEIRKNMASNANRRLNQPPEGANY